MNFPLFFGNFLSQFFIPSPSTIDLSKDMIFEHVVFESNHNFVGDLNPLYILNH